MSKNCAYDILHLNFGVRRNDLKKKLLYVPHIDDVKIRKSMFEATIYMKIVHFLCSFLEKVLTNTFGCGCEVGISGDIKLEHCGGKVRRSNQMELC